MYLVKSPLLLKWFYSSLTWNKSRKDKIVYLTFDDGPIPNVTDFVLNTLKSFGAKATFFCIGDNIRKHPEIFDRIKLAGHSIGNHTYHHLNGWQTENTTYLKDMLACQALTQTNLFRPPHGRIKLKQIKQLRSAFFPQFEVPNLQPTRKNHQLATKDQLQIIMWDVLSGDFDINLSPEKCYHNVIKHVENGSIIVFHDSLKAFDRLAFALPKTLKYLTEKGYQFGIL